MGQFFRRVFVFTVGFGLALSGYTLADTSPDTSIVTGSPSSTSSAQGQHSRPHVARPYVELPLSFEPNRGQGEPAVRFVARGPGFRLALAPDAVVTTLIAGPKQADPTSGRATSADQASVRIRFLRANTSAVASGEAELPGKSNYFIGNDPSTYISDVPTFARVRFSQVYPGIDVVYYGNKQQLEYDFVVARGADPDQVRLAFDGVMDLRIETEGHIVFETALGSGRQLRPIAFQIIDGKRRDVDAHYRLLASREVGLEVGDYDASEPLVIDPILSYSTYLGGQGWDGASAIAVDAAGNAYITGTTPSTDFPLVNQYDRAVGSNDYDAFVTKLNPDGTALVYSTYLGGRNGVDRGLSIAVDAAGSAYIAGTTTDNDYPTTTGAYQLGVTGNSSFVTKLGSTGNSLVYSTYLHNAGAEGLALDNMGSVYVSGMATAAFTTTQGAFQSSSPFPVGRSPFVLKLNAAGTAPIYSTFLGGSGVGTSSTCSADDAMAIAIDSFGNAYVVGRAYSTDMHTAQLSRPLRMHSCRSSMLPGPP